MQYLRKPYCWGCLLWVIISQVAVGQQRAFPNDLSEQHSAIWSSLTASAGLPHLELAIPDGYRNAERQSLLLTDSPLAKYRVPMGRNFYITRIHIQPSSYQDDEGVLRLNQKEVLRFNVGKQLCSRTNLRLSSPLLIRAGTEIALVGERSQVLLEGFTVDAEVQPVFIPVGEDYTPPAGKTLVLTHYVLQKRCDQPFYGVFDFEVLESKGLSIPIFVTEGESARKALTNKALAIFGYIQ
ncbi:hypothetical protein [Eisenibacter elegans]|jgi:hypothetical protein|uniref:hypothetical protein n=1 Tax=Eisenibacter elegans TaxID=997 RepID=UPI00047C3625|nr:hypothetical protein [Eisenibacter elegans]